MLYFKMVLLGAILVIKFFFVDIIFEVFTQNQRILGYRDWKMVCLASIQK